MRGTDGEACLANAVYPADGLLLHSWVKDGLHHDHVLGLCMSGRNCHGLHGAGTSAYGEDPI